MSCVLSLLESPWGVVLGGEMLLRLSAEPFDPHAQPNSSFYSHIASTKLHVAVFVGLAELLFSLQFKWCSLLTVLFHFCASCDVLKRRK